MGNGIDIYQPIFGNSLIEWFSVYGYLILLPLMTLEGRIVGLVAAALANLGYWNVFVVWGIAVVAGQISDVIYYSIGRFGSTFLNRFGFVERVTDRFKNSPTGTLTSEFMYKRGVKIFFFTKSLSSLSWPLQTLAGVYRLNTKKYLLVCASANIVWSTLTIATGYFMGYLSQKINIYIFLLLAIALVSTVILLGRKLTKRLSGGK